MALNLRLDDGLNEALKKQAELEGCSMHTIVLRAVERYLVRDTGEPMVRENAIQEADDAGAGCVIPKSP